MKHEKIERAEARLEIGRNTRDEILKLLLLGKTVQIVQLLTLPDDRYNAPSARVSCYAERIDRHRLRIIATSHLGTARMKQILADLRVKAGVPPEQALERPPEPPARKCICCKRQFQPPHANRRMCDTCKDRTDEYHTGWV